MSIPFLLEIFYRKGLFPVVAGPAGFSLGHFGHAHGLGALWCKNDISTPNSSQGETGNE